MLSQANRHIEGSGIAQVHANGGFIVQAQSSEQLLGNLALQRASLWEGATRGSMLSDLVTRQAQLRERAADCRVGDVEDSDQRRQSFPVT